MIFIITSTNIADIEVVDAQQVVAEEPQISLAFDLPLQEKEDNPNTVIFELTDETKELEVNEPIEIIPVTEVDESGVKRYSLDDYMAAEKKPSAGEPQPQPTEVVEEEMVFEKKTVAPKPDEQAEEDADPFDLTIEESLRMRANERRRTLKEFNYKFRNNMSSRIEEIEKQPAYKRAGIELDENAEDAENSRISVSKDSNDDIQLRSNNSFLHDNVD